MVILELIYKKSLDEVNKYLDAHREFLSKYYSEGIFIASGPKIPRDGGVILALIDKDNARKIITEDPFFYHEIAEYKIIEFEPNKYSEPFKRVLEL